MIAFPEGLNESTVLAALALVNIDDAVGASSVLMPLSNFSRIVAVTFQNANQRVLPGDPRRTPFFDELKLRFSVPGPDDTTWTVIYLPGPSRVRDEAAARVLTSLSPSWAWDGLESPGGSRWLLLPPLVWAAWLIVRNPRRDRLRRALWVVSLIPLLLCSSPGATTLYIVLSAALAVASQYALAGAASRLPFVLWPHAIASMALPVFEPDTIPYLVVSIAFAAVATYLRPRIERLASRRRLHELPSFRNLTMSGVHQYARGVNRALLLPLAAMIVLAVFLPSRAGSGIADEPRFRIERAAPREHYSAGALFEEHLAYQRAITYGRLGDFSLEDTSYVPVYRYREEDGRMRRADDSGFSVSDWPAATFKAAIMALSDGRPASILPK